MNAGLVAGEEMQKSVDDIEITFAASMVGHRILTLRLLEAGLLPDGARIVLVGSSVANNDTPAFMGMTVYDFGTGVPTDFGYGLHEAMRAFVARSRLDHLRG